MRGLALALVFCGACADSPLSLDAAVAVDAGTDAAVATPDMAVDLDKPLAFVTVASTPKSATGTATFLPSGSPFVCNTVSDGNCTFYDCQPRPGPDGGAPAVQPNPGAVDITGGADSVHLAPAADGYYDLVHVATALYSGGETLHVVAAGGTVPAFSGDVTAPAAAHVTAPAYPTGDYALDRRLPQTFTWTVLTDEQVLVTFGADTASPIEVECVFKGSAGTGTVPTTLLAHLPVGGGYFEVKSRRDQLLPVGVWQVTLRADSAAVSSAGKVFSGATKIQ